MDPATRLPALAAAPPVDEGAAAEQQPGAGGGGDTGPAAAMLAEIWKALAVFGLLPQALGQLAAHFMEHSVAPILASGALNAVCVLCGISFIVSRCAAVGSAHELLRAASYSKLVAA